MSTPVDDWAELVVIVHRSRAEAVGSALFDCGASGLQEDVLPGEARPLSQPWDTEPETVPPPERVVLRSWWPLAGFEQRLAELESAVRAVAEAELRWTRVRSADWAVDWRASFRRVAITDRLVIAPPWSAEPKDLVIEPGMAFGTGEHPTTRRCLEAVDRLAVAGRRCLDVGTGSGVLALAAAQRGMVAWGIDLDPDAVRAARNAAVQNKLSARFDRTPLSAISTRFDLVLANLYAEVQVSLAANLVAVTGGRLVLAGILVSKADQVIDALAAVGGLAVVGRVDDGDWTCLELSR